MAVADDSHSFQAEYEAYIRELEAQEWSRQLVAYAKTLQGSRWEQCVIGIRKHFGVPYAKLHGAARSNKPDTKQAEIGSVIVLNLSYYGHVGKVIAKDSQTVTYIDWNGGGGGRGTIRTININDKRIIGYIIVK